MVISWEDTFYEFKNIKKGGKKVIGIYCIENKITKEKYVGLSTNIEKRWKSHIQNNTNSLIHIAIKKYGKENFNFYVLEECDEKSLCDRERYWIGFYDSIKNGYNQVIGGNKPPVHSGKDHHMARLSNNDIDEIYELLQTTDLSYVDIAKYYKVNNSSIGKIDKGLIRSKEGFTYPLRKNFHEKLDEKAKEIIYLLESTLLTHKEIATKCNVSKSTVAMINIGKNHFNKDRIYPIRQKINSNEERNKKIIYLLKETNLTYRAIAERFNLSISTISDINKGRKGKIETENYPIRKKV